ncbi:MAG: 50S ribosomal protein L5 [Elusimicrobia bacterium CG11_big_fil_rev_8_21_14_0_20_64_6]|nr:MAG: 50S ribosomal protein L5 [Elusimicrobia bacterium CG11_big_fil_rev_8_21_14_0_20_64_6]
MAEKTQDEKAKAAAHKAAQAAKKAGLEKQAASKAGPAFELNAEGRETEHPTPRLKVHYRESVIPSLMEKHGMENQHEVPSLRKIVLNIGVSEARDNVQMLDNAREELALISGQWPQVRKASKSISNFKLRQGMPIGVRVTLRGDRMWEFLDRLIAVSIPRIRDFRGLEPKGFDGSGNFNLGLKEQLIFPEINAERVPAQRGMNISFVIGGGKDNLSLELLQELGMPFKTAEQAAKKGNN